MKYSDNIQFIEELRKLPRTGETPAERRARLVAEKKAADQAALMNKLYTVQTSKLKDLTSALNEMGATYKHVVEEQGLLTGTSSDLAKAFSNLNQKGFKLQSGILGIIGTQQKLKEVSDKVVQQVLKLEIQFGNLNKVFGVGMLGAGKLAQNLVDISDAIGTDHQKTAKYVSILKNFIPLQAFQIDKTQESNYHMLQTADILQKNIGVSGAATEGYLRYTAGVEGLGGAALSAGESIAESMAGDDIEKKSMFMKEMIEGIGTAGAELRTHYGKIPGSLEAAVLKSRQLGISMDNLNKVGSNLLDIETSVGNEIEYQLLTGQRLLTVNGESLTAKLREAYVQGDMNKQADLMHQLIKSQGPMLRKSVFARESMAKLLGVSVDHVSEMLEKEEFLSEYGLGENAFKVETEGLQEAFEASDKFKNMTDKQQAAALEKLAESVDTRTTQKRNLDALEAIETHTLAMATRSVKEGGAGPMDDIFKAGRKALEKPGGFFNTIENINTALSTAPENLISIVGETSNIAKLYKEIHADLKPLIGAIPGATKITDIADAFAEKTIEITAGDVTVLQVAQPDEHKASGGPVLAGKSYVVGERGPEVFTPQQSGNITANNNIIDYNKLASAVASAVSRVQITVPPDIYGASTMNQAPV